MNALAEIGKLRSFYPGAEQWEEGGAILAFIPGIRVPRENDTIEVNGLLWPYSRDGYSTRLFLDRKIPASKANNWNPFTICGETWWACSWNQVPASLPWIEILANHLRALK